MPFKPLLLLALVLFAFLLLASLLLLLLLPLIFMLPLLVAVLVVLVAEQKSSLILQTRKALGPRRCFALAALALFCAVSLLMCTDLIGGPSAALIPIDFRVFFALAPVAVEGFAAPAFSGLDFEVVVTAPPAAAPVVAVAAVGAATALA